MTEIADDDNIGYILEVDLEYSNNVHSEHTEYPLAPVNEIPPQCTEKETY